MAIQQFVRPEDLDGRIVRVPMPLLQLRMPGITRAGSVAVCMRNWFARRELRYIPDPHTCDLWGRPSETFRRGGGDCDDLAIVVASACHFIRIPRVAVVIGIMRQRGKADLHAWVEGGDEAGWFMIEATTGELFRTARPSSFERSYARQYILTRNSCIVAPEAQTMVA